LIDIRRTPRSTARHDERGRNGNALHVVAFDDRELGCDGPDQGQAQA